MAKYLVYGKVIDGNDELPSDSYLYAEYEALPYIAFCKDCDKVLYPCRTEAGANKVCDKHMGYKKYSGHKAEVRYEKTVCTTADILGTEANRKRTEQLQAVFDVQKKQAFEQEEKDLMPKINSIVEALGVEYRGKTEDGSKLYNFYHEEFNYAQITKMDIDIAFDYITGEGCYSKDSVEENIKTVWYRISKGRICNEIPSTTDKSKFVIPEVTTS